LRIGASTLECKLGIQHKYSTLLGKRIRKEEKHVAMDCKCGIQCASFTLLGRRKKKEMTHVTIDC